MPRTRTAPHLAHVGTSTGTLAVYAPGNLAAKAGTVYPLVLRGVAPGPVAWVAHRQGTYVGHERSRAAAVRAVLAAQVAA